MKRRAAIALLFVLFATRLPGSAGVIDRILVTVNSGVVLASDVDEALAYEALVDGRPLAEVRNSERSATLQRLIDQELLRQQIPSLAVPPVPDADVESHIAEIRQRYPQASDEQKWHALLQQYGLPEESLRWRVRTQQEVLRVVDLRLRPAVRVDRAAVDTYYRDQLLPKLNPAEAPSQDAVNPKIREILTQQRLDEMLSAWLHNLRQQSRIHYTESMPTSASIAQAAKLNRP